MRSFLGQAAFYKRFIRRLLQIVRRLNTLLEANREYNFNESCQQAFESLRQALITASILVAPNWSRPFELMCDTSNYVVGAMLGQRKDRIMHPIFYANKTLNDSQENYTTIEK